MNIGRRHLPVEMTWQVWLEATLLATNALLGALGARKGATMHICGVLGKGEDRNLSMVLSSLPCSASPQHHEAIIHEGFAI